MLLIVPLICPAESEIITCMQNPAERATVLKIAEMLQAEDKEYCFISPYDAQRNLMEKDMINAGLDWKDKCFNVDSFQGEWTCLLYCTASSNLWVVF